MNEEEPAEKATNVNGQKATALWEEYKHRHDLIWRLVFQVTTAAVILSVVPYIAPMGVRFYLKGWIMLAPVLATVLMGFSLAVADHELKLLAKIRGPYWRLQKDWLGVPHNIPPTERIFETGSRRFVWVYFGVLAVVSVINIIVCAKLWSYLL